MKLGDTIIDSRNIPEKNFYIPGYLEGLKKDMIENNEDIIDLSKEKPEFSFKDPPPKKVNN